MVLVDDLTSLKAVEHGIDNAYEALLLDNGYSVKILKEVTLFLYNELKHGVSLKSLTARLMVAHGRECNAHLRTMHGLLMSVVTKVDGVNLKLETRNFVYEPSFGRIKLKRTNEEVISYHLTCKFAKDGVLNEATLRPLFTLEVMEYNDLTLTQRFSQSVLSEIKGMFNLGDEGIINKRLRIIEGHLSTPNPLRAYTMKGTLSFLPMCVVEALITINGALPDNYREVLKLYAEIGVICESNIAEFDDALVDTGKDERTALAIQEA